MSKWVKENKKDLDIGQIAKDEDGMYFIKNHHGIMTSVNLMTNTLSDDLDANLKIKYDISRKELEDMIDKFYPERKF